MIAAVISEGDASACQRRLAELAARSLPLPLIAELRLDASREDLGPVLAQSPLPTVVSCRRRADGGLWDGEEGARRERLLAHAPRAAWVDVEEDWLSEAEVPPGPLVIASLHDLHAIPEDLEARVDRARRGGADLVKVAVRVSRLADLLRLRSLARGGPTVIAALGEAGKSARLLFREARSAWTYARFGGRAHAPGLPEFETLARLGPTLAHPDLILGVIGDQAYESIGPAVWPEAMAGQGRPGLYLDLTTADLEGLGEFLREFGFRGASVTTPFKEELLRHADEVAPRAAEVGAANTVSVLETGRLRVDNTDVAGVSRSVAGALAEGGPGGEGLVLGAGGAARAAAVALRELGLGTWVASRGAERAETVARDLGLRHGWPEAAPRVVVNATPAGGPRAPGIQPLPAAMLGGPGQIVVEMNYRSSDTPLLAAARARGCEVISGLRIYAEQAAEQAALFGLEAEAFREALARGLGNVRCWDDETASS
jgi:3-dehydroquinate dehydratase/shikimate dehydrogenase